VRGLTAVSLVSSAISVSANIRGITIRIHVNGGYLGGTPRGTRIDGFVVVTFTVNADATVPFGVTEAGAGVQVASDGAPEQLSATVPLNPLTGATCRLYVAGCPGLTVAVFEPPVATSMVKSVPVPLKGTACGLPEALSVIVTFAVRFPVAVGLNVTLIEQFAAAATLAPHVFVSEKSPPFVPVMAMLVMFKVAVPLLVSVTFCAALAVVTSCPAKFRLVGASVTAGAVPVPVRATLCGLPGALFVIVTLAARFPVAVGLKVALIEQFAPAATLAPQVFV
jgi:hypothetical protein